MRRPGGVPAVNAATVLRRRRAALAVELSREQLAGIWGKGIRCARQMNICACAF